MRKTVLFVLVATIILSMTVPAFAGWQDELQVETEPVVIDRNHPSYLDLDDVDYSISYPNKDDYLDDYKVRYVKSSPREHSVYALHGLKDGAKWEEMAREVENDTRVVVIAEHSYVQDGVSYTYCCGIYEEDGNVYAGWIHKNFLVSQPGGK